MARDWGKNNNGSQLRGKLGGGCGCSYRRTTLFVCSINIVVALFVLRTLYASIYLYSSRDSASNVVRYTPDQIRAMMESVRIRNAAEPLELLRLVKQLEERMYGEETVELPRPLKQKIRDQILQILKRLNASATVGEQRG